MAVGVLGETLSRRACHREASVLLGALAASPRASQVYGSDYRRIDAVEAAARTALRDTFEACRAEGAALGDVEAVALARRLTRSGPLPTSGGGPGARVRR